MTIQLTTDNTLRQHITANLQAFTHRQSPLTSMKHAAVAITVVNRQGDANIGAIPFAPAQADQAAFILTIRTAKLKNHAGQRAFPGGRIDPGESPERAALRELQEEVGIALPPENILGRLDDYATRSGFVITPVVVWGVAG